MGVPQSQSGLPQRKVLALLLILTLDGFPTTGRDSAQFHPLVPHETVQYFLFGDPVFLLKKG
jgi:hypothetical protein